MRGGRRDPSLAPDPELVRSLAELLTETGLTEIEYAVGDARIRVAREPAPAAAAPTIMFTPPTAAAAPAAEIAPARNAADHPGALKAPMVGVAYLAAQPGTPPFVKVDDIVAEGQTLLIIEAMKVMNQIRAPRAGRIAEILIADGEPVEYGAVLMLIE